MIGGASSCRTRSGVHMFFVLHRGSADPRLFTLEPFVFVGHGLVSLENGFERRFLSADSHGFQDLSRLHISTY
jgi:hypothetical protein